MKTDDYIKLFLKRDLTRPIYGRIITVYEQTRRPKISLIHTRFLCQNNTCKTHFLGGNHTNNVDLCPICKHEAKRKQTTYPALYLDEIQSYEKVEYCEYQILKRGENR